MVTKKTPAHKRIKRAETGRDDWKIKATERREEIEKLRRELESKDVLMSEMSNRNQELETVIIKCSKQISDQDKLIESLKKKSK